MGYGNSANRVVASRNELTKGILLRAHNTRYKEFGKLFKSLLLDLRMKKFYGERTEFIMREIDPLY